MIERYVILDNNGHVVGDEGNMHRILHNNRLRVYDREKGGTQVTIDTVNGHLNLEVAKACVVAFDDYIPENKTMKMGEIDGSD